MQLIGSPYMAILDAVLDADAVLVVQMLQWRGLNVGHTRKPCKG